jgi:hypothetical protein
VAYIIQAIIRSKLEYASVVWAPHTQVERVQRKMLKYVAYRLDKVYPERGYPQRMLLHRFSMHSLEERRNMCVVIFLFKLIHNGIDCPFLLEKIPFNVPRRDTRNFIIFYLKFSRIDLPKFSPIYRMCSITNSYGNNLDIFSSNISSIKKLFSNFLDLD